jgi:hypothetical protein
MNPFQGKVQSMKSEGGRQKVRLRPDEKTFDEGRVNERLRGSKMKLSTRGPKRQHRRHRR